MSLEAIQWALFTAPTKNPTEKIILAVMADRVGKDGRGFKGCWASHQWIADAAGVSVSTVQRYQRRFEERGLIRYGDPGLVAHLRKDRRPVVWDLVPGADSTTGQFERPCTGAATTGHSERNDRSLVQERPVTAMTDKPSMTRPDPSKNRPARSTEKTLRDWKPTDEQWAKLEEKHEGKDIDTELEKFKDWHIKKRSKYKNWYRAFDNWLKKVHKSSQQLFKVNDPDPYGLEDAPF